MTDFIVAIGLVLAIEGTLYAVVPGPLKRMMRQAIDAPDQVLRIAGVGALAIGVVIVWMARG